MRGRVAPLLRAALALALLAGCASQKDAVQRATEGPTADEIYLARFQRGYGRGPTFDETMAWRADFDKKVTEYITRQPGMVASPRVGQFRVQRRVAVGMTREEVALLVGLPELVTPEIDRLHQAVAQDDPQELDAALPPVLAWFDTPQVRAQIARGIIALRASGDIDAELAAAALVDLTGPSGAVLQASLLHSAAVAVGAERTPAGLVLTSY